ncbi:MAG: glycosyltransferase family 4 protein [Actinomycetota bacterium]
MSTQPERDTGHGEGQSLQVLMVSARFAPFVGGTEIHTGQVSAELVRRGHRVTVLTTDLAGTLPEQEWVDGVEVVRVRAYPRRSDLYYAPGLRKLIDDPRWDLVHVQGYHTAVAPLALRAAQRHGHPTALTFHSGGHSSRLRNLIRPIQVRVLKPYLLQARALIGVSRFEAELFSRRIGISQDRIAVIPNGVDRPKTGSSPDGEQTPAPTAEPDVVDPGPVDPRSAAEASGCGPDDKIILSAGRLVRYKGHHRMIKAMPKILADEPRARLLILGQGPYESSLRRLVDRLGIADRVTFDSVPSDERDRLEALFRSASVAVVLSDYESHGMVAHEAIDVGLPLVVLDRSALGELAASGAARAVPPRATRQEVAEIVLRCLAEEATSARRSSPRSTPANGVTWPEITDRLEGLYRRVLADESASGGVGSRPHVA